MNDRGIMHHGGAARALGLAWAETAPPRTTVLVGRDEHYGSRALAAGLAEGLCAGGVDVVDVGLLAPDHLTYLSATLEVPAMLVRADGAGLGLLVLCDGRPGLDEHTTRELQQRAAQVEAGGATRRPRALGRMAADDTTGDFAAHLRAQADVAWLRPLRVAVLAPPEFLALACTVLDVPDVTLVAPGRPADITVEVGADDLVVRDERGQELPAEALAALAAPDAVAEQAPWGYQALWGANSPLLAALCVVAALGHARLPLSSLVQQPGALQLEVGDPARVLEAVSRGFGSRAAVVEQSRGGEGELELVLRGEAGGRGSWQLVLRPQPDGSLLHVQVTARDDLLRAAVREDARAIIESAA